MSIIATSFNNAWEEPQYYSVLVPVCRYDLSIRAKSLPLKMCSITQFWSLLTWKKFLTFKLTNTDKKRSPVRFDVFWLKCKYFHHRFQYIRLYLVMKYSATCWKMYSCIKPNDARAFSRWEHGICINHAYVFTATTVVYEIKKKYFYSYELYFTQLSFQLISCMEQYIFSRRGNILIIARM